MRSSAARSDARRDDRAVQRLRAVPRALPGGLHRDEPAIARGRRRRARRARPATAVRRGSPAASGSPSAPRSRPATRGHAARDGGGRHRASTKPPGRKRSLRALNAHASRTHSVVCAVVLVAGAGHERRHRPRRGLLRTTRPAVGLRQAGGLRDPLPEALKQYAAGSREALEIATQVARAQGLQRQASMRRTRRSTRSRPSSCAWSAGARALPARARARLQFVGRREQGSAAVPPGRRGGQARGTAGDAFYEIDALHMLGIAAPVAERLDWNMRALVAAGALDGRARPRLARVRCTTTSAGRSSTRGEHASALGYWEKSLARARGAGDQQRHEIARWTVARGYRALGRLDDAERMQRDARRGQPAQRRGGRVRLRGTGRDRDRARRAAGGGAVGGEGLRIAPRGRLARRDRACAPRAARERSVPARAGRRRRGSAMKPQKRREIFERLAARNPHPTTELGYASPFELLVAVVLSAQSTDKGVNKVTAKLFPAANTPAAIATLGVEGLDPYVESHRAVPQQGEARGRLRPRSSSASTAGRCPRRARRWSACRAWVARRRTSCSTPRSGSRRSRSTRTSSGSRTGRASRPARTCWQVERGLEAGVPEEFRRHAHHWLILHGRYVCVARKPKCASARCATCASTRRRTGPQRPRRRCDPPAATSAGPAGTRRSHRAATSAKAKAKQPVPKGPIVERAAHSPSRRRRAPGRAAAAPADVRALTRRGAAVPRRAHGRSTATASRCRRLERKVVEIVALHPEVHAPARGRRAASRSRLDPRGGSRSTRSCTCRCTSPSRSSSRSTSRRASAASTSGCSRTKATCTPRCTTSWSAWGKWSGRRSAREPARRGALPHALARCRGAAERA